MSELQVGDMCEVFRMPDECVGIKGADANVGKRVRIVAHDVIGHLMGHEGFIVEFLDGETTIWAPNFDPEDPASLTTKQGNRGACPADCLRKVEVN